MRILSVPYKTMDVASSRIRYYTFLNNLPKDATFKEWRSITNLEGFDVVYIQKRSDSATVALAQQARRLGIPVVFDADDILLNNVNEFRTLLNTASVITTDTEPRAQHFREMGVDTDIRIVPDCIDYLDAKPNAVVREELKCVGAFGNECSAESQTLEMIQEHYNVFTICYEPLPRLSPESFIKWNRNDFISNLSKADCCVVAHSMSEIGKLKSNNRLILCMALGIPALVSDTPEYARTMWLLGRGDLILGDSPLNQLASIRSVSSRQELAEQFQDYAWSNFAPSIVGPMLYTVFQEAIDHHA